MSSAQPASSASSMAQSRRFACNRCHKHKLKCERTPVVVNGTIVTLPLGTCRRCEKAQVPCETIMAAAGSVSSPLKPKSPMIEGDSDAGEPTPFSADLSSPVDNDMAMFGHLSDVISMVSTNANSVLDLDSFDFDTADFTEANGIAVSYPTPLFSNYSAGAAEETHSHGSEAVSSPNGPNGPNQPSVDSSGFQSVAGRKRGSPLSSASHQSKRSQSSPLDHQEECRKRLLELHSLVFGDLHGITDTDLAKSLFSINIVAAASRDADASDIISRVLKVSEHLLELLGIFSADLAAAKLVSDSSDVRRPSVTGPLTPSSASSASVGLPVIISFLTCYVGLLSVYRTIFLHVHATLSACERSSSTTHAGRPPSRSASQKGLMNQLDKGVMDQQHVLTMRIQLEVMTHMLDRIERAWAGVVVDDHDGEVSGFEGRVAALFGRPGTMDLLKSMLIHEGYHFRGESFRMGLGSLEVALNSIRRMLRSNG